MLAHASSLMRLAQPNVPLSLPHNHNHSEGNSPAKNSNEILFKTIHFQTHLNGNYSVVSLTKLSPKNSDLIQTLP